jgi:hypothetical protein
VTAIHIPDQDRPLDYNPQKAGEFYDTCPHDGCLEVDASFRNEGTGDHEGAHDWSIFSADRRKGGCGGVWSRTTPQGQQRLGKPANGLTSDALAERSYWIPSQAYRDNYDRIFKKGAYAPQSLDVHSPQGSLTPCDGD